MAQGQALLEAGDAEGALRAFRSAAVTGAGARALAPMGTANLALGRLGQAERLLRRATALDPADAAAWNNLGAVLMEADRPAEARAAFERALALGPDEPGAVRENLVLAEARAAPVVTSETSTPAAEPERSAATR
jgi:Flp pilus assembly protein TadD